MVPSPFSPERVNSNNRPNAFEQESLQIRDSLTCKDVVCGRNKLAHCHPGNKDFRRLVSQHGDDYRNTKSRSHKKSLTCLVIETIHDKGGRFLKVVQWREDEPAQLVQASEEYVYEKVSHALRSSKPGDKSLHDRKHFCTTAATVEEEDLNPTRFCIDDSSYEDLVAHEQMPSSVLQNYSGSRNASFENELLRMEDSGDFSEINLDEEELELLLRL